MDSIKTKVNKLIEYGKNQLQSKGVDSTASDLRGVLDGISYIQQGGAGGDLLNVIKGINSYETSNYPFELTADMFDENSTYIPASKYYGNNNIISAYIPNNITNIGASSFYYCKGLKRVHIPDSVINMGSSAFSGCSNLEIVDISDIVSWCNISFNGTEANPLVNRSKLYLNGELVTDLVIPEGVTKIPQTAFSRCNSIKTITLPNTLTSIGASSFSYSYITNITIPDSVTSMDGSSFYGASLESVTIGNGLTKTGNSSFYSCSKLKSVTFGSNIANLGSSLFQNCYSLAIVDFRNAIQVPTVQSTSFKSVPKTCKFIIPDELYDSWIVATNWASLYANGYKFIKVSEYYGTDGLAYTLNEDGESYTCSGVGTATDTVISIGQVYNDKPVTVIGNSAFVYCKITGVIIGSNVTRIERDAFSNCTNLTSITIPASVTNIGQYAFNGCNSLIEVYNKSSLDIVAGSIDNGYVGYYAKNIYTDEGGSKLSTDEYGYIIYTDGANKILVKYTGNDTDLSLPNDITEIYQYAFFIFKNLTSVTIGDSVTRIGVEAFSGCSNLTSLSIGNSVTSIENYAFSNCSSFTSVTIGNSVTSISYGAFHGCSSLTSVTIPNSVTSIGNFAFDECTALQVVDFRSATQVPTIQSNSFYAVPTTCKYIVPDSLYDEWIVATNWTAYESQIIKPSEYVEE